LLDGSDAARLKFFNENAKRILTQEEVVLCFDLLEMQKLAMFIFASCGWFFSEISGIEAVQNLRCAARAMQIAKKVSGISLESKFLDRISEAESNIKLYKNGRGVYEKLVRPLIELNT
jgi:hypothetical protein